MTFINEVVSDADIEAYGLPFRKGGGRWWTRDRERDLYLWGGRGGNPEWGEEVMGRFHFFLAGVPLEIGLSLGTWSRDWTVRPYVIAWEQLEWIRPEDCRGLDRDRVISLLKEALICYGSNGDENRNISDRIVRFGF